MELTEPPDRELTTTRPALNSHSEPSAPSGWGVCRKLPAPLGVIEDLTRGPHPLRYSGTPIRKKLGNNESAALREVSGSV